MGQPILEEACYLWLAQVPNLVPKRRSATEESDDREWEAFSSTIGALFAQYFAAGQRPCLLFDHALSAQVEVDDNGRRCGVAGDGAQESAVGAFSP
jgi:hypothetical protein